MTENEKKTVEDFVSIQKDFFMGVVKSYFSPMDMIFAFFGVFMEMFRQMFVSLAMDSYEFETLQDLKFLEETADLSLNGMSEDDIELEME